MFAPWLIAPASDASRDSPCVYAADNNKVCGRPDCRAKGIIPRPLLLSRRAGRRSLFRPALPALSVACGATAFAQRAGKRPFSLPRRRLRPAFGASGRAVRLPADVTVGAVLATRCNNRPAGTTIRHFPSGMSCGGTIALTREGLGYQVRVNWLTGGVEVVPVN